MSRFAPASRLTAVALLSLAALLLGSCGGGKKVAGPGPGPGPGGGGSGTGGEATVRWESIESASDMYFALKGTPSRDASTVSYLLSRADVAAAGVSDSLQNVWACFKDGRVLLLLDNQAPPAPAVAERAQAVFRRLAKRRAAFAPGSELPASNRARLLNSLEARWHSSIPALTSILEPSGYQVNAAASDIPALLGVQGDGILYWASHAGEGNDLQGKGVFGIWTASLGDSNQDKVQPIKGYWDANEICYACTEVQQADGTLKKETHYAITQQFIRNRMSFADNSVVFIDACTSLKAELRDAFWAKNASVYCGWDDLTTGSSWPVCETFFDLLCGTDEVMPQYPRQRPFLFDWVRDWMIGNSANLDPGGAAKLYMNRNPAKPQFGLLRPTIFTMFVHDTPDVVEDYLEIEGDFGLDPGEPNRDVTIGGAAQGNVTWSEHILTVPLARSGPYSYGDVTVTVRGHLSNVAHLTRWSVPFTYIRHGQGSLQQQIDATYILRADIGEYRNLPFATPTGLARAISSTKVSSATYLMSGIYQPDPDHFTQWVGGGSLAAATNIAEYIAEGYMSAAGNVSPTPRTMTSFVPQARAHYTIVTEASSTPATAVYLPFGILTLRYDASDKVLADSVRSTLSDGDAVLRWGPATPDAPFNNGGR